MERMSLQKEKKREKWDMHAGFLLNNVEDSLFLQTFYLPYSTFFLHIWYNHITDLF